MKRPFAYIGFSTALTLLFLNVTDIKYIPIIGVALSVFFVTTLILPEYRQEKVFPVCFGFALFACILYITVYYSACAPAQLLSGKEAASVFYITDLPKSGENGYVYIARAKAIMLGGAPQNIKLKIKSEYPIYADAYTLISGKLKFYSVGKTSFSSFGNWGKGIYLTAYVDECTINKDCVNPLALSLLNLREDIIGVLCNNIGGDSGALAAALITGDKSALSDGTYFAFKAAGASHLMSVSGLHLTVLSGAIAGFLKAFRIKERPSALINIVFIVLFSAMTGFSRSVVRAGIMMCVMLSGYLFKRRADALNSLGLATFIICLNPFAVSDAGAVLSVCAVLSLCTAVRRYNEFSKNKLHRKKEGVPRKILLYITDGAAMSLCIVLFTLPVMYIFFGYFSVICVFINVFIIPLGSISTVLSPLTYLADKTGFIPTFFNTLSRGLNGFIIELVKLSAESSISIIRTELYFGVVLAVILVSFAMCFFIGKKRLFKIAGAFSLFLLISVSAVTFGLDSSRAQLFVTENGAVAIVDGKNSIVYGLNTKSDYYAVSSFLSIRDSGVDTVIVSMDDKYSLMLADRYSAATLVSPVYNNAVISSGNIKSYVVSESAEASAGGIKYVVDYSDKTPLFSFSVNGFNVSNSAYDKSAENITVARKTVYDYNGYIELDDGELIYDLYKNKTFKVRRLNVWQG